MLPPTLPPTTGLEPPAGHSREMLSEQEPKTAAVFVDARDDAARFGPLLAGPISHLVVKQSGAALQQSGTRKFKRDEITRNVGIYLPHLVQMGIALGGVGGVQSRVLSLAEGGVHLTRGYN